MNRDERIVVVGAGLTGLRAAERLRELKFEGEIMILGDEKLPPYHRPALSKQLLMGTLRASDLTLPAYEDLNAKWRFGTQVRQLLPRNKTLQLPGGEELTYDGLIIATGVEAKRPNDLPYYDPRVLVLRTMSDGLDLERVIGSTRGRVAVVGGGFTGCELAASLRHLSREVTLIGRQANLLGNVLGPELGEWLTNLHRDHGVDLALGNSVQEWSPAPEGIGLKLTDGTTLLASCVLVAAGTVPMTGWLRGSGLPLDNGVVCEPTCHVVGAEDVVAAGDVAQWPNLRFDNVPRRVEHWLNAVEMGRAAAESLLAGRAAAEPFTPMPRFWTEQYGIRIQAAGMPKLGKDIITLGTPDEGTGTVYGYSKEGRLMGVVGVDCPSSVLAWTDSVSRQNPAPRPRVEAAKPSAPAITAGGKKRAGRHSLPKETKPQREERREHEIAYVEEPRPAEVGVGTSTLPPGRPKNVVDSFSRMLPVKVRPPHANGADARPAVPSGPLPPAGVSGRFAAVPPAAGGAAPPATASGLASGPSASGFAAGPLASASGRFATVPPVGEFAGGPSASASGRFAAVPPAMPSGRFAAPAGRPARNGRPALPPAGFAAPEPTDRMRPPQPQFRAVEGLPEPLAGRLGPDDALAIDVTGQMALLDANGHVRTPEFSDPLADAHFRPPMPPRGGPQNPFGPAGQVNRPPSRRGGTAPRGPEDSFRGMPPVRGAGPEDSFGGMPPVRRGPEDSLGSLPPVRRGPEDSLGGVPPVRRGPEDSLGSLPPVRRGPEDSFGGMPPVRRAEASFGSMPPVRRGPEDSFGSMPPVGGRGGSDGSFAGMPSVGSGRPPARRGGGEPAGRPGRRGPRDSFDAVPPARRGSGDSVSALPPAGRGAEDSFDRLPAVPRGGDSLNDVTAVRGIGAESLDDVTAVRGPEDSFDAMPPVRRRTTGAPTNGGRAARRRAEESLGRRVRGGDDRPRQVDPALSKIRLVPAVAGMDDALERLPKHGRPEDYDVLRPRSGPEDSYDRMAPVERPARSSGGRRRA